jgi:hypothetical protein
VGVLTVERPIEQGLVDEALAALRADPDSVGNAQDERTLARAFLHASDDSKNGHSWLARAISKRVTGEFRDSRWEHARDREVRSERALHGLVNALSGMHALEDEQVDHVHFVIARRQGSFDESAGELLGKWLFGDRLGALIQQPEIPMRFPRVTVEIVGAAHPGIQVCDFLLWAAQRRAKGGSASMWLERAGMRMWVEVKMEGEPQEYIAYYLGVPAANTRQRVFRDRDLSAIPAAQFPALFQFVEQTVVAEAARALSDGRTAHLRRHLETAAEHLQNDQLLASGFDEIAQAFLLVCDTSPVYDVNSPEDEARGGEARRLAAAILDKRDVRWIRLVRQWADCRRAWRK